MDGLVFDHLPKFQNNSTFAIVGSSRSGKTDFTIKILHNLDKVFVSGKHPSKVLYCYKVMQDKLINLEKTVPSLTLHKGLPSSKLIKDMSNDVEELLIVLDDLVFAAVKSPIVADLFASGRHYNISVIFITQNIFEQGKYSRIISLNTCYTVLFKNVRDRTQISRFGSQMYSGEQLRDFMRVYDKVMETKFQYLIVDFHPYAEDIFRLRNNILTDELHVYTLDAYEHEGSSINT